MKLHLPHGLRKALMACLEAMDLSHRVPRTISTGTALFGIFSLLWGGGLRADEPLPPEDDTVISEEEELPPAVNFIAAVVTVTDQASYTAAAASETQNAKGQVWDIDVSGTGFLFKGAPNDAEAQDCVTNADLNFKQTLTVDSGSDNTTQTFNGAFTGGVGINLVFAWGDHTNTWQFNGSLSGFQGDILATDGTLNVVFGAEAASNTGAIRQEGGTLNLTVNGQTMGNKGGVSVNDLTVGATSSFACDVSVAGTLNIADGASLTVTEGTLTVATLNVAAGDTRSASITGNVTLSGALDVSGNSGEGNAMSLTFAGDLTSASTTGDGLKLRNGGVVTVEGSFSAELLTLWGGKLTLKKGGEVSNLNVQWATSAAVDLILGGDLYVKGNVTTGTGGEGTHQVTKMEGASGPVHLVFDQSGSYEAFDSFEASYTDKLNGAAGDWGLAEGVGLGAMVAETLAFNLGANDHLSRDLALEGAGTVTFNVSGGSADAPAMARVEGTVTTAESVSLSIGENGGLEATGFAGKMAQLTLGSGAKVKLDGGTLGASALTLTASATLDVDVASGAKLDFGSITIADSNTLTITLTGVANLVGQDNYTLFDNFTDALYQLYTGGKIVLDVGDAAVQVVLTEQGTLSISSTAEELTWEGSDSTFAWTDTATGWKDDATYSNGAKVTFASTSSSDVTVTITGNKTVTSLTFGGTASYILTKAGSETLTVQTGLTINADTTLQVDTTVGGVLDGTATLTLDNTRLTLSDTSAPHTFAGTLAVAGSSTLEVGSTLTLTKGINSPDASLTIQKVGEGGTVQLGSASSLKLLTLNGKVEMQEGASLSVGGLEGSGSIGSAAGATTTSLTISGGEDPVVYTGTISVSGALSVSGGEQTLDGDITASSLKVTGTGTKLTLGAGAKNITGGISIGAGTTLTLTSANGWTQADDTGRVVTGEGTLVLSDFHIQQPTGGDSITGPTNTNILNNLLGTTANTLAKLELASGSTFDAYGGIFQANLEAAKEIFVASGASLGANSAALSGSGHTLRLAGTGANAQGALYNSTNAAISVGWNIALAEDATVKTGSEAGGTLTFTGEMNGGTHTLTKLGAADLILGEGFTSAADSSGTFRVQEGSLTLSSSTAEALKNYTVQLAGGALVTTVDATLGVLSTEGSGALEVRGGTLTLETADGATLTGLTLAGGASLVVSAGSFTIDGTWTWNTGSTLTLNAKDQKITLGGNFSPGTTDPTNNTLAIQLSMAFMEGLTSGEYAFFGGSAWQTGWEKYFTFSVQGDDTGKYEGLALDGSGKLTWTPRENGDLFWGGGTDETGDFTWGGDSAGSFDTSQDGTGDTAWKDGTNVHFVGKENTQHTVQLGADITTGTFGAEGSDASRASYTFASKDGTPHALKVGGGMTATNADLTFKGDVNLTVEGDVTLTDSTLTLYSDMVFTGNISGDAGSVKNGNTVATVSAYAAAADGTVYTLWDNQETGSVTWAEFVSHCGGDALDAGMGYGVDMTTADLSISDAATLTHHFKVQGTERTLTLSGALTMGDFNVEVAEGATLVLGGEITAGSGAFTGAGTLKITTSIANASFSGDIGTENFIYAGTSNAFVLNGSFSGTHLTVESGTLKVGYTDPKTLANVAVVVMQGSEFHLNNAAEIKTLVGNGKLTAEGASAGLTISGTATEEEVFTGQICPGGVGSTSVTGTLRLGNGASIGNTVNVTGSLIMADSDSAVSASIVATSQDNDSLNVGQNGTVQLGSNTTLTVHHLNGIGDQYGTITGAGKLKITGTGTFGGKLELTGGVEVTGTSSKAASLTLTGGFSTGDTPAAVTLTVGSNATVSLEYTNDKALSASTVTLNEGTLVNSTTATLVALSGSGTLQVKSGTLTLTTADNATLTNLALGADTTAGNLVVNAGNFTISGGWTWTEGSSLTLGSKGQVITLSGITLNGGNSDTKLTIKISKDFLAGGIGTEGVDLFSGPTSGLEAYFNVVLTDNDGTYGELALTSDGKITWTTVTVEGFTWDTGTSDSTAFAWNADTTGNQWTTGGTGNATSESDKVTFTNGQADKATVTVTGAVKAASVTINGSGGFAFDGTGSITVTGGMDVQTNTEFGLSGTVELGGTLSVSDGSRLTVGEGTALSAKDVALNGSGALELASDVSISGAIMASGTEQVSKSADATGTVYVLLKSDSGMSWTDFVGKFGTGAAALGTGVGYGISTAVPDGLTISEEATLARDFKVGAGTVVFSGAVKGGDGGIEIADGATLKLTGGLSLAEGKTTGQDKIQIRRAGSAGTGTLLLEMGKGAKSMDFSVAEGLTFKVKNTEGWAYLENVEAAGSDVALSGAQIVLHSTNSFKTLSDTESALTDRLVLENGTTTVSGGITVSRLDVRSGTLDVSEADITVSKGLTSNNDGNNRGGTIKARNIALTLNAVDYDTQGSTDYYGALELSGKLTKDGDGVQKVQGGSSNKLSAADVEVKAGTLVWGKAEVTDGSITNVLTLSGGNFTLEAGKLTVGSVSVTSGALTVSSGELVVSGGITGSLTALTLGSGETGVALAVGTSDFTLGGTVTLNGENKLTFSKFGADGGQKLVIGSDSNGGTGSLKIVLSDDLMSGLTSGQYQLVDWGGHYDVWSQYITLDTSGLTGAATAYAGIKIDDQGKLVWDAQSAGGLFWGGGDDETGDFTWGGDGAGNFDTDASGSGDVAWTNDTDVHFMGKEGTQHTVTLGADITTGTFGAEGTSTDSRAKYTFKSGDESTPHDLTVGGDMSASHADLTFESGVNLTVEGNVALTDSTLTLYSDMVFTGSITGDEGSVKNGNTVGAVGTYAAMAAAVDDTVFTLWSNVGKDSVTWSEFEGHFGGSLDEGVGYGVSVAGGTTLSFSDAATLTRKFKAAGGGTITFTKGVSWNGGDLTGASLVLEGEGTKVVFTGTASGDTIAFGTNRNNNGPAAIELGAGTEMVLKGDGNSDPYKASNPVNWTAGSSYVHGEGTLVFEDLGVITQSGSQKGLVWAFTGNAKHEELTTGALKLRGKTTLYFESAAAMQSSTSDVSGMCNFEHIWVEAGSSLVMYGRALWGLTPSGNVLHLAGDGSKASFSNSDTADAALVLNVGTNSGNGNNIGWDIVVEENASVRVLAGATDILNGKLGLTDEKVLTKKGDGTLQVNGEVAGTGTLAITAGTVLLSHANTGESADAPTITKVELSDTGTLATGVESVSIGTLSGSGTLQVKSGVLTLGSANDATLTNLALGAGSNAGNLVVNAGSFTISGGWTWTDESSLTLGTQGQVITLTGITALNGTTAAEGHQLTIKISKDFLADGVGAEGVELFKGFTEDFVKYFNVELTDNDGTYGELSLTSDGKITWATVTVHEFTWETEADGIAFTWEVDSTGGNQWTSGGAGTATTASDRVTFTNGQDAQATITLSGEVHAGVVTFGGQSGFTLAASDDGTLSVETDLTVNTTLICSATVSVGRTLSGTGNIQIGSGSATDDGASGSITFSGDAEVSLDGWLAVAKGTFSATGAHVKLGGGLSSALLGADDAQKWGGTVNVKSLETTVTESERKYEGKLTVTGALTKKGAGKQTIYGSSLSIGSIDVQAGTLHFGGTNFGSAGHHPSLTTGAITVNGSGSCFEWGADNLTATDITLSGGGALTSTRESITVSGKTAITGEGSSMNVTGNLSLGAGNTADMLVVNGADASLSVTGDIVISGTEGSMKVVGGGHLTTTGSLSGGSNDTNSQYFAHGHAPALTVGEGDDSVGTVTVGTEANKNSLLQVKHLTVTGTESSVTVWGDLSSSYGEGSSITGGTVTVSGGMVQQGALTINGGELTVGGYYANASDATTTNGGAITLSNGGSMTVGGGLHSSGVTLTDAGSKLTLSSTTDPGQGVESTLGSLDVGAGSTVELGTKQSLSVTGTLTMGANTTLTMKDGTLTAGTLDASAGGASLTLTMTDSGGNLNISQLTLGTDGRLKITLEGYEVWRGTHTDGRYQLFDSGSFGTLWTELSKTGGDKAPGDFFDFVIEGEVGIGWTLDTTGMLTFTEAEGFIWTTGSGNTAFTWNAEDTDNQWTTGAAGTATSDSDKVTFTNSESGQATVTVSGDVEAA